jgi:hypothetical protein
MPREKREKTSIDVFIGEGYHGLNEAMMSNWMIHHSPNVTYLERRKDDSFR